MKKGIIVAVDFDGTIVTHEFPEIGKLVPGAIEVIECLRENGYKVFLYTMRSHRRFNGRDGLAEATRFLYNNGIILDGINRSPEQFSDSLKQYAHIYIDDSNLGCPMFRWYGKWVVDWKKVARYLVDNNMLTIDQYSYICMMMEDDFNDHPEGFR